MIRSIVIYIITIFSVSSVFSQRFTIITEPIYSIKIDSDFAFFKGENYKNIVVDTDGTEIHFDNVDFMGLINIVSRDRFIVQLKNQKYVLIDKKGKVLSDEYDWMGFSNYKLKLVVIYLKKKIGFLNIDGKIVFPPIYDQVGYIQPIFINNKIKVELNGKQQIMTTKGTVDYTLAKNFRYINQSDDGTFYGEDTLGIPFKLDKNYNPIYIERFVNRKNKKEGLYDNITKKQVIPAVNDHITIVGHDQYVILNDSQMALYDKKGNPIFDFGENLHYGYYSHGIMSVQNKSKKYGFINTAGKTVIPFIYDKADDFSRQGLTIVSQNGKSALMNLKGKYLTPFKYDLIDHWDLNNELIKVQANGKWGYINTKGEELTLLNFTMAGDFEKGFAVVGINNKYGMIDKTGKEIVPIEYDWIRMSNSKVGRAVVTKNVKFVGRSEVNRLFGIIDNRGNIIVPCMYDYIEELPSHSYPFLYPDSYYYYKKNSKIGILKCD